MVKHNFQELSREVQRLGDILGEVIVELEGPEAFKKIEQLRALCKKGRAGDKRALPRIRKLVSGLSVDEAFVVAMAFSSFFELINLAEENYRISILNKRRRVATCKKPPRQSIADALVELKKKRVSPKELQGLLDELSIELVFTAHPTESKRRTILQKLMRIFSVLQLSQTDSTQAEEDEELKRIITSLWLTDRSRLNRPEVADEVRAGLWYLEHTLWDVVPQLNYEFQTALHELFPTVKPPANWIKFGSWIGGDRDGHPGVTSEVTQETLVMHRECGLDKLARRFSRLASRLSISSRKEKIPKRIVEAFKKLPLSSEVREYPNEPYRELLKHASRAVGADQLSLDNAKELLNDVALGLYSGRASLLADGDVRILRQQLDTFGYCMSSLDLRQHSEKHAEAIAEVFEHDYLDLDFGQKVSFLEKKLKGASSVDLTGQSFSKETRAVLDPIKVAKRALEKDPQSMGIYVISMAADLTDVLETLLLQRLMGVCLPIAPLFETLTDLNNAPEVLTQMFSHGDYKKHLRETGEHQTIMLGYSDSNKDCGYLSACWALSMAQASMAKTCARHKIAFTLFHGRGGTISRGGGPAARAILAQPEGLYNSSIRVTEQGEVLSNRYHRKEIAHRVLEQMTYGVLLGAHQARKKTEVKKTWVKRMDEMTQVSTEVFRDLVYRDQEFITFWREATPIEEIGKLNIGSRPTYRKKAQGVQDIRAIPWVFSWLQTRFVLTSWYGLGSGLETVLNQGQKGVRDLQQMYSQWTFFQSVIDNAQLALSKADLSIARLYPELVKDQELAERFTLKICDEFKRTQKAILKITKKKSILDNEPILKRSIKLRNPYVDPLNFIQVDMLHRLHQATNPSQEEQLRAVIELTINGIAAGLKNTG